ncbi:MAG: energy transducer TonB [Bacteroides sp.]|nr:energy transducer TonB [Bacteroides sp.]
MKKILLSLLMLAGATFAMTAADKPTFPGGDEALKTYLSDNMKYPSAAKANGVEGVVNVGFMVKADGSIGSIKIIRMVDPDLEQEAIRLVKNMPAWTPADKNGAPVDALAEVAVPFVLE